MEQILLVGKCVRTQTDSNDVELYYELLAEIDVKTFYRIYSDKERTIVVNVCSAKDFKKYYKSLSFKPYDSRVENSLNESNQTKFNYNVIDKFQSKNSVSGLLFAETEGITLHEAKDWLNNKVTSDEGVICPCCNRYTRRYKRKITKSMILGLHLIKKSGKTDYIHLQEFFKNQDCPSSTFGDVAKLRFWGLIDKLETERPDGSHRNGFYRITQQGIDFLEGKLKVPPYVIIRNDIPVSFSTDEPIGVFESSLQGFNFRDLMDNK